MRRNIGFDTAFEEEISYSPGVRFGNTVFVSGTVGRTAEGFHQSPFEQTMQALRHVETVLKRAGARREDVVMTRLYVTDMTHWKEILRAHGAFFHGIRPASTLVGVTGLVSTGALVEIEAYAEIGQEGP